MNLRTSVERIAKIFKQIINTAKLASTKSHLSTRELPALTASSDCSYHLILDDDNNFSNGGTVIIPMTLVSGDVWAATVPNPGNGYFTFEIKEPVCQAKAPVLSK